MKQHLCLLLLLSILGASWAAGRARFTATDVTIRNRPFITGTLTASKMYYDKAGERIGWDYTSFAQGSISEAFLYAENIRLRKCADSCEGYGEDRQVPDLVSSGSRSGTRNGCDCYNESPSANNGEVDTLCFDGNNICYVEFSSGETWEFDNDKISTASFPADAFLDSVAEKKKQPNGGGCTDECSQVFDIVLVLDESGSIDSNEWKDLKAFAVQLVEAFEVGTNGANFAIKLYASSGRNLLQMSANKNSITNQLENISKRGGSTCIGCGIQLAVDELNRRRRPNVPALIVTLTDGRNNRPSGSFDSHLTTHTNSARNAGYKMVSVGVGNNLNQDDLKKITSVWPDDHILVQDFSTLEAKLSDILTVICPVNTDNDCGATCKGFCHCGQECTCPSTCEPIDKCHTARCVASAGFACVQEAIKCDDGNLCTTDTCNPNTGCVFTDISSQCDSNSDCIIDSCDPKLGCLTTDKSCPVVDKCIEMRCDNPGGCQDIIIDNSTCFDRAPGRTKNACWQHWCDDGCKRKSLECDFGDKCRVYGCDENTGCTDEPRDCQGNDLCTVYDCDSTVGCTERPKDCNDNQVCTTDTCNPANGQCVHTPADDCGPCQYSNGGVVNCTVILASQLASDMCQNPFCDLTGPKGDPEINCKLEDTKSKCDTPNMCINSACNILTGECDVSAVVCESNDACIIDSCNPDSGCVTEARVCEKRDECEEVSCDKDTGCVYTPKNCDFGDPCKIYSCDPSSGCQEEIKCKPINNCFNNTCDAMTGNCSAVDLCDDKNECTIDTCDLSVTGGMCVTETINATEVCNDFDGCTNDICDPSIGCVNEYEECPNFNSTLECLVASPCHPLLGCRIGSFDCDPIDSCHIADCVFVNATATEDSKNTCENTKVDNVLCVIGAGAVAGLSIGAGVLAVIIIAVIVALILASLAAAKAYQVLTADGMDSGAAQSSQIFKPDGVEGESQIFA